MSKETYKVGYDPYYDGKECSLGKIYIFDKEGVAVNQNQSSTTEKTTTFPPKPDKSSTTGPEMTNFGPL